MSMHGSDYLKAAQDAATNAFTYAMDHKRLTIGVLCFLGGMALVYWMMK